MGSLKDPADISKMVREDAFKDSEKFVSLIIPSSLLIKERSVFINRHAVLNPTVSFITLRVRMRFGRQMSRMQSKSVAMLRMVYNV